MLLRVLILLICVTFAAPASQAEETLGQALKKIFSSPTPTPHRKKKTTSTATKKKSPTPTPSPSSSPKKKRSPAVKEEESPPPSPSSSPKKKHTPAKEEETPSPSPSSSPRKKKASPTPRESPEESVSPSPSASGSPRRKKKGSPTPSPSETPAPSKTPEAPVPSPQRGAPNASLSPEQIKGFENYPENIKKLLGTALELTTRNLNYKYGSDDPASGGMDCSGFVYYVLKQNGVTDVPRDSSSQYVWLRRAGKFEPVLSRKDNSFELENLKPGDLLFWTGTYSIDRDPPITHAMIYLGRENKTGKRVMVGASDGRVYEGESRYGVSVFDFTIPHPDKNGNGKLQPAFVGYGHVPGFGN